MKTLIINPSILTIQTETDNVSTLDIATLASATVALAKACKAFASVKTGNDKRATFASIASVARITESDAATLCRESRKGSTLRDGLRRLRSSIVQRVRSMSVVHDASVDSATIVKLDRIVSALGTIVEHEACILRTHTCAEPATV
jgi:hypothetical protein